MEVLLLSSEIVSLLGTGDSRVNVFRRSFAWAGRDGGAEDWSGEDIIDVVETDTAIRAFSCYTPLRVPTQKRSGGDSKSLGSLVGGKEGLEGAMKRKMFLCWLL